MHYSMHRIRVIARLLLLLLPPVAASGQLDIRVREVPAAGLPGVQSYAFATHNGTWLLIGGRLDGLHRRQPWATFLPEDNNKNLLVIDPYARKSWSRPLTDLPLPMQEQLQATNFNAVQHGDLLYLTGGYGYAPSAADHITHPYLTIIDVPGTIQAIQSGAPVGPFIRFKQDARMQVTGGQLGYQDGWFYLMGGQHFKGRYNPMGPNNGPGFFQAYTNAIRKFQTDQQGNITGYQEWVDSNLLHRRDYNAVPQIFPDGSRGFTMFSGVFRPDADLPWLNSVDVTPTGFALREGFNQFLNHYHCARVALHNAQSQTMYTVFFGGISRYTLNPQGVLVDDPNVPFVRTISTVERRQDGSMLEYQIGQMPALLGAGAEFIPAVQEDGGIVHLQALPPGDSVLLGHIFGGIESSAPNIFFSGDGDQSEASGRLFEVWLFRGTPTAVQNPPARIPDRYRLRAFPNPTSGAVQVAFEAPIEEHLTLQVFSPQGRLIRTVFDEILPLGVYNYIVDLTPSATGLYRFVLSNAYGVLSETTVVR